MPIVDCQQGTPEWFAARLGIPTASCFDRLITPSGKPSSQAGSYANKLVAEWLVGHTLDEYENDWMRRGTELEPQARAYYELQTDADVRQVGFVTTRNGKTGCSPDGLIGRYGLLEIKCPAPHTHVGYLIDNRVPPNYVPQVQGQMLVTGRRWCDFLSYHPEMPPVLFRVHRDVAYIQTLRAELTKFNRDLARRKQALLRRGIGPMVEEAA